VLPFPKEVEEVEEEEAVGFGDGLVFGLADAVPLTSDPKTPGA